MALSGFVCDQCRARTDGSPHVTVTGRRLCGPCHDELTGLAAGMIASGDDVGTSIATAGWFSRLRRRRESGG